MSIENAGKRKVRPTHPGEMLREDFLPEYGLTTSALAAAIGVAQGRVRKRCQESTFLQRRTTMIRVCSICGLWDSAAGGSRSGVFQGS